MLLNDLDWSFSRQYYCWCLSQRRPDRCVWSVTETWTCQTSTLLGDFKPKVADKLAWWKWGLCEYRWCRYSTAMTLCNQHELFQSINLVFCRFPDIILYLFFKRSRRFSAPRLGCDGNLTSGTNCCSCFCGNHCTVTITYTRVQSAQQFSEIKTITPDQYQCLCQVGLCLVILDKFIISYLFFKTYCLPWAVFL